MGNFFSNFRSPRPQIPKDRNFTQVNESVFQLYPSDLIASSPTVDVVFFHGLQASNYADAYWRTWRSRDGTVVWPADWLGPRIPGARIFSISYDSVARKLHDCGRADTFVITESIVHDLIEAGVGQTCPVVLVGHSLGGIIIKHVVLWYLVLKGRETSLREQLRIENFLRNCKGVFYYSSPHGGSELADWVIRIFVVLDWVVWVFTLLGLLNYLGHFLNYPIVSLLRRLSTKTAVLNREFTMAKHNLGDGGLRTRAIGESLPINLKVFKRRVVQIASAMQDVDGDFYTAPLANHYDVCKPKNNTTDPIFTYLLSFINDLLQGNVVRLENINEDDVMIGYPAPSSQPRMLERPPGIQMLNESVWQFYAPPTVPEVEVVFFHGLQPSNYEEAFWRTWLSRDEIEVWPRDWLSATFKRARTLSISYVSIAQSHPGWTHPSIIAENVIQDMIAADVGQNSPVILVGHSLGGLIIKKVLVQCIRKKWMLDRAKYPHEVERLDNFMNNCKGVFFYSVPHHGSKLAEYASQTWGKKDPLRNLLRTVVPLDKEDSRLTDEFRYAKNNLGGKGLRIGSISETVSTRYMGFKGVVTEEASARHCTDFHGTQEANHFDICKPRDRLDPIFTRLVALIGDVVGRYPEE